MSDSHIMNSYLSTAYLPPVEYIRVIANSENSFIERCENYQRQTYRNRCHIYSASGLLALTVPVHRDENQRRIDNVRIDYSKSWQKQHWRAIFSAYNSSPFFDYYKDDLYPFYQSREESLFLFNTRLLETILNLIGIENKPGYTQDYQLIVPESDFRESICPKKEVTHIRNYGQYHQVFAHKSGFLPNLSIIDLLFNEGPNSITYF